MIMDNLSAHKVAGVQAAIEATGARMRLLPPYSPDFNPIELACAKLKALLRRAAARTIPALWNAIGDALPQFVAGGEEALATGVLDAPEAAQVAGEETLLDEAGQHGLMPDRRVLVADRAGAGEGLHEPFGHDEVAEPHGRQQHLGGRAHMTMPSGYWCDGAMDTVRAAGVRARPWTTDMPASSSGTGTVTAPAADSAARLGP